jgi:hypothetical protein
MDASEALATAAQVAVAIAGFTGVVVAFGTVPIHEWSDAQRFRLKMLIATSVFPLFWSLMALFLLTTGLGAGTVWTVSSVVAFGMLLAGWTMSAREFTRLDVAKLGRGGPSAFRGASGIGLAALALQVYNIFALHAFWPFFAMVTVAMMLSMFQFVRMTLDSTRVRRGGRESAGAPSESE